MNTPSLIVLCHLDSDSGLRKDLELGSVIGNISEELLLVAIPLDAVQGVSLHIKPVGNIIYMILIKLKQV